MIARNPPMVFRFAAMLLLSSAVLGQWWQRQPLGADGHALVTVMHSYCPGVGGEAGPLTVADSARLLDRWGYALLGDLTGRNGRDRCTLPRPLWLAAAPQRLAEVDGRPCRQGPLTLLAGPERIESGWWDSGEASGDIRRDYFIALSGNACWLWIYRECRAPGGWFLQGFFS